MLDHQKVKKMNAEQARKLFNCIRNVENSFVNSIKCFKDNVPLVLLLGPTGSGKTTLTYGLHGSGLKCYETKNTFELKPSFPSVNLRIGETGKSETSIPGLIYGENERFVLCDCPGFFNNISEFQDICNSFLIRNILRYSKDAKILLICSINDILSSKGKIIRDSCHLIEKLIPDQYILFSSVALVISKVDFNLQDMDISLLDNIDPGDSILLKHFKDNENGRDKNVFNFYEPDKRSGFYSFVNKNHIVEYILRRQDLYIIPTVSLSSESKLMILNGIDCFGNLRTLIQRFVNEIAKEVINFDKNGSNNSKIWLERLYKLMFEKYSSPEDFVNKARNIIVPSPNSFESIYQEILKLEQWKRFLEYVFTIEEQKSELMSSVFLDISPFLNDLLSPWHAFIDAKLYYS